MKRIIILLILLIPKTVFCQVTFIVDNFSNDYFGKLYISDTSLDYSEGWVAVFDKRSNDQLIKVNSDQLTLELHEGKVLANIKKTPYGEQSQIIYEDFNFDGMNDFAIMDGQNSFDYGPSFQIFLATDNGFVHSPEFSELSQNYTGMFDMYQEEEEINTVINRGCCWHQYSVFHVKDNKPYPTTIIEAELDEDEIAWHYEEQNLVNGKMIKSKYEILNTDIDEENILLSFKFENNKKMQIVQKENILIYLFTDAQENVELLYFDDFEYSIPDNTLSFTNHNTKYIIYDYKIVAETPKKRYDMYAVNDTLIGTLEKLKSIKLDNLNN